MFYTLDKKKKKNIDGPLQSDTNLCDLSKNENEEKSKKRKSKKNSNEQSIKKIKNNLNPQQIEAFDIKPEIVKGKIEKPNSTLDKKKKKNIEGPLQSETNLSDLSKNGNVEKSKKRKSKKNSNEQSIKKIKNNLNPQQIEVFDTKPEIVNGKIEKTNGQESLVSVNNKTNQINDNSNSRPIKECHTSETFEKKIKKKKTKKPKDNSIKPNDKPKKIEKKSSTTNST